MNVYFKEIYMYVWAIDYKVTYIFGSVLHAAEIHKLLFFTKSLMWATDFFLL